MKKTKKFRLPFSWMTKTKKKKNNNQRCDFSSPKYLLARKTKNLSWKLWENFSLKLVVLRKQFMMLLRR